MRITQGSIMAKFPAPIQRLISQLRRLPGVGGKTAERYAFHLLDWEENSLSLLSQSIESIHKEISFCPNCFCLKGEGPCEFCDVNIRQTDTLCIVSSAKDVYPIEETRAFKGLYHVIGGLFSPMQGYSLDKIDIHKIKARVDKHAISDIILALDSTVEGDATALLLKEEIQHWNVSVSRLASGIPLGSALDYVDPGTLARALLGRHKF
jgi:recombination protein RecR